MADQQCEGKCRALPHLALYPDSATMQLDELAGKGQPEPGALHLLVRRPDLTELLEDRILIFRCDAHPAVADGDLRHAIVYHGTHVDPAALRRELERVG